MLVQFLWHIQYPWDVRVEKISQVCVDMGLSVGVICRNEGNAGGLPKTERKGRALINRVGSGRSLLSKLWSYPLFFSPIWWQKAMQVMHQNLPSILVVRDIPLAMTGIWLGRKFGVPVVLDMAENYPAALIAYQNPAYKPFLICDAYLPRAYERAVVKSVDHILVVAEEQIERLSKLGVSEEKVSLIRNTPDLTSFTKFSREVRIPVKKLAAIYPCCLYIGKIDIHRGVELMIRGLPEVLKSYPKAGLVLVGDGKEKASLEKLVWTLGLQDHVIFTGWINHSQLPAYIRASTICCIPHLKSEHTDTTIPNKLFDYMALGKAIVTSNLSPVKRIVENVGCGQTFESGDGRDFARVFVKVISGGKKAQMGQRGMEAVMRDFNWTVDSSRLKSVLHRFLLSDTLGEQHQ
jgi:glycosyltransferase involved in cell wall biosynthesis